LKFGRRSSLTAQCDPIFANARSKYELDSPSDLMELEGRPLTWFHPSLGNAKVRKILCPECKKMGVDSVTMQT
jgi:hypothetical protein